MKFHKSLWLGFFLVAAGWTLVFAEAQIKLLIAGLYAGEQAQTVSINFGIIAQCTILSGFGVAILGSLQTGFSALNQFFDAVLARSEKTNLDLGLPFDLNKDRRLPLLIRQSRGTIQEEPSNSTRRKEVSRSDSESKAWPILKMRRNRVEPAKTNLRKIVERGWVKDRAYVLFADGAVEVETMLGLRRFPSLQDAQDFIS